MANKIFIDTNILLDFFDEDRVGSKDGQALLIEISNGSLEACISESVITTFDYLLAKTLSKEIRSNIILDLSLVMTILSCDNETVALATKSKFPDFEDAMLYEIAARNEADYFITNDKSALKKLGTNDTEVISCKDFLKLLR